MKTEFACAVIAVFAIVFGLVLGSNIELPREKTWDEIADTTSILVNIRGRNVCSGTIIGRGKDASGDFSIIATAAHCFRGVSLPLAITQGDKKATAVLLGQNKSLDVAILKSSFKAEACVEVRSDNVEYNRGDQVFVIANPDIANYRILSSGIISAPVRPVDFGFAIFYLFTTTAQVMLGSSGGAVLDQHGRMIGIVAGMTNQAEFSLMTPVSSVKYFIRKLNLGEHICYG